MRKLRLQRSLESCPWTWALILSLLFGVQFHATGQEETDSPVPEEDRAEYEEMLRRWEDQREALFDELVVAVQSGDRIETYFVLKRLHGGGAGPDGSDFELRLAEIRERKAQIKLWEKRLKRMTGLAEVKNIPGMDSESYQQNLEALQNRIAKQQESVARLEKEALEYAEKAIVAELPVIFELLSGGLVTDTEGGDDEDPFAPPNSH